VNLILLHKNKFILIGISLLVLATNCVAQTSNKEKKKWLAQADETFLDGDFFAAKSLYEKLIATDSTHIEYNYKLGVCNYKLKKFKAQALNHFRKTNAEQFPEANYYLGLLYHSAKDFDRAKYYFNHYKNIKAEKEHTLKETDDLLSKCFTAKVLLENVDKKIKIENLGAPVNTEYSEYAPLIPADEKFLLLTSRKPNKWHTQTDATGEYFEDIYITTQENSNWNTPQPMDTIINNSAHDACTGLSADGEKLLIYRTGKDKISGDIFESNFLNNAWSAPKLLDKNLNADGFNETSACYSADGDIIFFSSDRDGGYGGKDLYFVKKLTSGKWGKPFNLGPTINTEYNEDAPFVAPTGNIIYFSSEGHKNMGGYDVFKSEYNEKGEFTEPENMGVPINTVGDDIFFVINTNGDLAYLSSEREGGKGGQDIYKIMFDNNKANLTVYSMYLTNENNEPIKNAELVLTDMHLQEVYGIYKPNESSGKILIIATPNSTYRLAIQSFGYESQIISQYTLGNNTELNLKLRKLKE
jgi:tetratricopeptide (TPR) repeat protein